MFYRVSVGPQNRESTSEVHIFTDRMGQKKRGRELPLNLYVIGIGMNPPDPRFSALINDLNVGVNHPIITKI